MWFAYVIGAIIWGIVWGWACNKIIENKGYDENWFWWGFWFGIIAFIVALTKQDNHYNYQSEIGRYENDESYDNSVLSQMAKERTEAEMMRKGGWKCRNCGRVNANVIGTCACGWTKYQSENNVVNENKNIDVSNNHNNFRTIENERIDILKKYKELLDMGAISQDEFNKKKNEILSNDDITRKSELHDIESNLPRL